jgi:xylulokinase
MKIIGCTLPDFEEETGLAGGIPLIAGSADHVASTLAAGIIDEGDLLIKFGGAGDILYCTETLKTSDRLFIDYSDVPGKYLINGCMAASGSLVKWFTKDICKSDDPDVLRKMDDEAAQLPPAADGCIVLPYFLGEKTPIMDPNARGILYGLTLSHTPAHIFRAILEAVIYGFRHHVEVISELGFSPKQIIATNGGAKSRFWCQIAADVLNREITAYPAHPGSALGVAFLAAKAAGVFENWSDIRLFLTEYRTFTPNPEAVRVYDKAYRIYRELYQALKPINTELTKLYEQPTGGSDYACE